MEWLSQSERLSVCERLIVWRSTHAGSGLCGSGGGDIIVCFWCCPGCAVQSGGLPVVDLENGPQQDGSVVGVFRPLPSGSASGPLSAHFRF